MSPYKFHHWLHILVILFISFTPFIFLLTKYLLCASSVVLVFGGVIALKKKKAVMILAFMGSFGGINPAVEKTTWCNGSELGFWSQTESESGSVMSDSLQPQGLCTHSPWTSPGQNTAVGNLSLLQGIFPAQGSNARLPHCRQILYQLSQKGSPRILEWVAYPFSSRSSQPRNWTGVSRIAGRFFTNWIYEVRLVGFKNFGPTICKLCNCVLFWIPIFPSVLSISAWQISSQCRGLKQVSCHSICGPGI